MSNSGELSFQPHTPDRNQTKSSSEIQQSEEISKLPATEEYFHPPIIRERVLKSGDDGAGVGAADATADLEGDQYFEPPIVREIDAKSDHVVAKLFSEFQKSGSAFLSELIQALNTIA